MKVRRQRRENRREGTDVRHLRRRERTPCFLFEGGLRKKQLNHAATLIRKLKKIVPPTKQATAATVAQRQNDLAIYHDSQLRKAEKADELTWLPR